MNKKFYAVRRGRTTGIFTNWDECRAQVDGYRGAVYKGFFTRAEADTWLGGAGNSSDKINSPDENKRQGKSFDSHDDMGGLFRSDMEVYTIYTDGSCLRNPGGAGGYAAVVIAPDGQVTELSGGEPGTTNNRMELRAGVEALKSVPPGAAIEFFTDSQYMKNAFTKYWLKNWKKKGWVTSFGEPVKNKDLWLALDEEVKKRSVNFNWVKGHAGAAYNERCDELAKLEAAKLRKR